MTAAILREVGPATFAVKAVRENILTGETFAKMPVRDITWPLPGSLLNLNYWAGGMPYKVSVIIVHYNDQRALTLCLQRLSAQDMPEHELEIIVADDGTPGGVDLTGAGIRRDIRLVINPRKDPRQWRNPAQISNMGLAVCEGNMVIVLHGAHLLPSSTRTISGMLTRSRGLFGRVMARTVTLDQKTTEQVYRDPALLPTLASRGQNFYRYVYMAPLGAFLAVGGYSQCWRGWGGEDIDLEDRLRRGGLQDLAWCEHARWIHLWHPSRREELMESSAAKVRWFLSQKFSHAVHDPLPELYKK